MIVLSENKKLNAIFKVSKERNLMSSESLNKSPTIQRWVIYQKECQIARERKIQMSKYSKNSLADQVHLAGSNS